MQEVHPQNDFILFNTAQKCRYRAFKSMWEGQINLGGHCPFLSTQASSHAATVASIALKQPYLPNYISTSDSSTSMVSTLCLSPDDQVKIWLLIPSPFSGQVHCFKTFMTSLQDIIKVTTMSHALWPSCSFELSHRGLRWWTFLACHSSKRRYSLLRSSYGSQMGPGGSTLIIIRPCHAPSVINWTYAVLNF